MKREVHVEIYNIEWEKLDSFDANLPKSTRSSFYIYSEYDLEEEIRSYLSFYYNHLPISFYYNFKYAANDDENFDEILSVYDAAEIWLSHGKDEDYMFGYTKEELEDALK